jgi:hypothetical protein
LIHQAINGVSGANCFPRYVSYRKQAILTKEHHQNILRLYAYESTKKIAKSFGVSQMAIEHILSSAQDVVLKTITSTYLWLFKSDKKWFYLNLPDAVPRSERRNNRIGKMPKIDLDE